MARSGSRFMRLAVREARRNLKSMDGGPFGACIVKGGRVIAVSRNTVLTGDATCHAEINAIRIASRKMGTFDLSGCVIYSTTEPCPMCFTALHWARVGTIVYGTTIRDAQKLGFNEFAVSNARMKTLGKSGVRLVKSRVAGECGKLLAQWSALPHKEVY